MLRLVGEVVRRKHCGRGCESGGKFLVEDRTHRWGPTITQVVHATARTSAAGDQSLAWMKYTKNMELCDDNLFLDVITAIEVKGGHVCIPVWV